MIIFSKYYIVYTINYKTTIKTPKNKFNSEHLSEIIGLTESIQGLGMVLIKCTNLCTEGFIDLVSFSLRF